MIGSILFTWLQGADFYRDLHRHAVESLPPGAGKTWLDVGCGPGLVTRLAAGHGYRAQGVDTSPRMIQAAQRVALRHGSSAQFAIGRLGDLPPLSADVVSAASLLAVLDDPRAGLEALWRCVRPGGRLLVIEPTARMNPANVRAAIKMGLPPKRLNGLRLWAAVRQNRAVDPALLNGWTSDSRYIDLLHGLVGAWVFEKTGES